VTGPTPSIPVSTPAVSDASVLNFQLNLRENPGEGAEILEVLPQNTPLDIIGRYFDNTWVQVRTPSGKVGWVLARLVGINIDLTTVPVVSAVFISPPRPRRRRPRPPPGRPDLVLVEQVRGNGGRMR
jgi:hypothetical protein